MKIIKKDAFEVFGIERIFKNNKLNNIPKFWEECHKNGSYNKLLLDSGETESNDNESCIISAICGYRQTDRNTIPYMICAKKTEKSKATGYIIIEIPASEWAVFRSPEDCADPASHISVLMRQAYKDWLPTSGYDLAKAPDMELYFGKNGKCTAVEVWIPVKKIL